MTTAAGTIYTINSARGCHYDVRIVDDPLGSGHLDAVLGDAHALLVTTSTVQRLYGTRIRAALRDGTGRRDLMVINSGEQAKRMREVEAVCRRAVELGLGRRSFLVAIGGGVCSDLVTMAAALYKRGIRHVRVPTTLVGQVDAGIGAKGAVNFAGRKSSLGCFHAPDSVLIDPAFLRSLPPNEIRTGLAEIVKMGIVVDRQLFTLVEQWWPMLIDQRFQEPASVSLEVIERSVRRMLEALESNLYEDRGYVRTVDAGHTFSPRLESVREFAGRHGDAVAVDLAFCASLAAGMGLLDGAERDRILATLAGIGLPVNDPHLTPNLCLAAVRDAVGHRGGRVNLPLPTRIGAATFVQHAKDLPADLLRSALSAHRRNVAALKRRTGIV